MPNMNLKLGRPRFDESPKGASPGVGDQPVVTSGFTLNLMKNLLPPSPRSFPRWLGSFALLLALAGGVQAEPWTRLYVFGDSYSDSGAGYVDGNGPTAVVYLARALNLPFTAANDPQGNGLGLNFAVSGAQTGAGRGSRVKDSLLGRGMQDQVADFVGRVNSGAVRFPAPDTLFFLAGGLNDSQLPTPVTIANLTNELRALYAVGARHFYVALLPTKIPAFAAVGLRLNPAIAAIPAAVHLDGATVRLSHWGMFYDQVLTEPGRYGLTNTTAACAGRALFNQDPAPRGDPEKYYYYHDGHPSTAVHRAVGRALADEIRRAGAAAP